MESPEHFVGGARSGKDRCVEVCFIVSPSFLLVPERRSARAAREPSWFFLSGNCRVRPPIYE